MKKVIIISKKPSIDSVVSNHLKIFKILQHFGFRHTDRPEHTNLEKKLLSKYDSETLN